MTTNRQKTALSASLSSQRRLFHILTLLAALLLMPANLWADPVGYAILTDEDEDGTKETLKFMYGEMPSGDDVWETTNTGTNNPGWYNSRDNITSIVFDNSFASARPQSCYKWFCDLSKVESITNLQYLDTREVTNMDQMFQYCSKLASLDLRSFNTSNVVTMNNMFYYCSSLTALDLRGLNSGTSSEPMTIRLNEQTSTSGISGDAAYVGIPSTETSGVTPSGTAYILVGDQFVLYEGSAAIPAHRCYLSLTSEARKRSLGIDFGDGTTSLRELEESEEWKEKREMWYTLDGRKLNAIPQKKGLYVRNGQKVVVK